MNVSYTVLLGDKTLANGSKVLREFPPHVILEKFSFPKPNRTYRLKVHVVGVSDGIIFIADYEDAGIIGRGFTAWGHLYPSGVPYPEPPPGEPSPRTWVSVQLGRHRPRPQEEA